MASIVAVTPERVESTKPSLSESANVAGEDGPMLSPNSVINSPGATEPATMLAAFTTAWMVALPPTVTTPGKELPPGAGLVTTKFSGPAAFKAFAGTTARSALLPRMVVVRAVLLLASLATEAP